MGFQSFFSVKSEFVVSGDVAIVREKLLSDNNYFSVRTNADGSFTCEAKVSFGTFRVNNLHSIPMSAQVKLATVGENTRVYLESGPRFELYLLTFILFAVVAMFCISDQKYPTWPGVFVLLLVPLWFQTVFRGQQKTLHQHIETQITSKAT